MRERGASIRVRSDRASDEVARVVDLFHLNRFGSYYKFSQEKMIDICHGGIGVKYHSLSYQLFVMTSPVEFSTDEFRAKQVEMA